ncbi:pyrimidine 5'-nucleotidase [Mameliella alba]|uniref:pyrimidine 5'-nucleotidase n=1 Tax=Mameliella alba TaxID=561184 RepID=UPI000884B57D|nr:pyrimidine 5'-nucleotidase [Mameliella alba]MBY6121081.1 pyrimidine 5'-nucleotidase [Mameliella alba]OWV41947.1 pyrimidine 5'-nucleotidase [Mameliella alba]OWV47443.1 pyrimidine 5'-nucleotidase [Mameliella alba]OWV62229.1 pyrimidine 5'-nucleotidase [Mameliella alba]PTR38303.1 putative hydrolase of the HAD superfamily [Mameliella alba]
MTKNRFAHVRAWVFDLDNTLYSPAVRLFDQIEARMNSYVMRVTGAARDEAAQLRRDYWARYGTTLAGLMTHHEVDPEDYLVDVHDISFDALTPDPHLAELIATLPGRRIVYTNGSAPYAAQVLKARGLEAAFDAIYGVEDAGYTPKPRPEAFERIFARDGLDPAVAAMFEDDPRNLAAPHAMGMRTVHVAPEAAPADHIHHHTDDLVAFLRGLK